MNLNKYKKGFSATNPERGLHSLAGGKKRGRRRLSTNRIPLSGKYIPPSDYGIPVVLSRMAIVISYISVIGMVIFSVAIMLGSESSINFFAISFFSGLVGVHLLVTVAESIKGTEITTARKSVKTFWLSILTIISVTIIAATLIAIFGSLG